MKSFDMLVAARVLLPLASFRITPPSNGSRGDSTWEDEPAKSLAQATLSSKAVMLVLTPEPVVCGITSGGRGGQAKWEA